MDCFSKLTKFPALIRIWVNTIKQQVQRRHIKKKTIKTVLQIDRRQKDKQESINN